MWQRVVAIVGAALLIGLALVARNALADDDGTGSNGSKRPSGEAPVVACEPDLQEVCNALADDGMIAANPPELSLDAASEADPRIDAWITWDPASRVVAFEESAVTWGGAEPIAYAPMSVLSRTEDLELTCDAEVTWTCIQRAPQADLSIGVGDPATSEGLARMSPFAAAVDDGEVEATVDAVEELIESPQVPQSPAATMANQLVTQNGSVDIVVGPTSVLERSARSAAGVAARAKVDEPSPTTAQTLILATRTDREGLVPTDICEVAAEQLAAIGAPDCGGTLMSEKLAGLLYQVHRQLG